jgi:hypothetical protein
MSTCHNLNRPRRATLLLLVTGAVLTSPSIFDLKGYR